MTETSYTPSMQINGEAKRCKYNNIKLGTHHLDYLYLLQF